MAKLEVKFIWVQIECGSSHCGTIAVTVSDAVNAVIVHLRPDRNVIYVSAKNKKDYSQYFNNEEHVHIVPYGNICRTLTLEAEGDLNDFHAKITTKLKHYDYCCKNCATAAKLVLEQLFPEHYLNSVERACQTACLCGACAMLTCGCVRQIPCIPGIDTPQDVFALAQVIRSYQMQESKNATPTLAWPPPEKVASTDLKKSAPEPASEQKSQLAAVGLFRANPAPDISFCRSWGLYIAARFGCLT